MVIHGDHKHLKRLRLLTITAMWAIQDHQALIIIIMLTGLQQRNLTIATGHRMFRNNKRSNSRLLQDRIQHNSLKADPICSKDLRTFKDHNKPSSLLTDQHREQWIAPATTDNVVQREA